MSAVLYDAHNHLDFPAFDADRDEVIARARNAGVTGFVLAGYDPAGWTRIVSLCEQYEEVYGALGLHPWALAELCAEYGEDGARARLPDILAALEVACAHPKIRALGETGLDATPGAAAASLDFQEEVFRQHIALARRLGLPLVIHALRAVERTIAVLRDAASDGPGGMMHSYSGSAEQVRPLVELGFYLSFCGPLTWKKARKPVAALRAVPTDRLLLETDAPDQSPEPHRGERNEPAHLKLVLAAAAKHLDCDAAQLGEQTSANLRLLLGLPLRTEVR